MRFIGASLILWMCLGIDFVKTVPHDCVYANHTPDKERTYAIVRVKHRRTVTTQRILFTAFKSLEEIDASATLKDISGVAAEKFGDHALADEWVKLCLHLRRTKKGTYSELKRFAELQIQILSEVDAKKYAEEIAAYQGTFRELDVAAKHGKNTTAYSLPLDTEAEPNLHNEQSRLIVIYDWDSAMQKRLDTLQALQKKNPQEARAKIDTVAKIRFENHPLADEWKALYLRLNRDGTGTLSDVKRLSELEIRMFTGIAPDKYAKPIQKHRELMKLYEASIKRFQAAGKNPEIFQVDFKSVD